MRKNLVRRVAAVGLLAGAGYAFFACSSKVDDDLPTQLQKDTGVAWGIAVDPRNGSPRVLTPATPVHISAGSPEADARAFFARYGKQLGTAGHDLRVTLDEPELGGGRYLRFQHYLSGTNFRVFDVVSMAHFATDGAMYVAQPGFRPGLDAIGHDPKISAEDASRAAISAAIGSCGADASALPMSAPELGVMADETRPLALAYRVKFGFFTASCLAPQFDVDAATGAVLATRAGAASLVDRAPGSRFYLMTEPSDIKDLDVAATSNGIFRLETESSPTKVVTRSWTVTPYYGHPEGAEIESSTPGNWDATHDPGKGAAVDAHWAVTTGLRYFAEAHGRHGADGSNGEIDVYVHDDADTGMNNGRNAHQTTAEVPYAFFFSQTVDAIVVGDGDYWWPAGTPDKRDWIPFSAAFDVMTHELTHAVTSHTSGLVYENESGALNETFSDVMGVSADEWRFPERYSPPGRVVIADRVARDRKSFLRDMIAPEKSYRPQPSTMASVTPGCTPAETNDQCGVHGNSGIGNRAWSLMTLGGTHSTTHVIVDHPLGFQAARVLWYETLTRLRPQATIGEAAMSQIDWTWQYDRTHFNTVVCAWAAVSAISLDPGAPLKGLVVPTLPPLALVSCDIASDAGAPEAGTTTASSSPCAGKSDGWVCDPKAPASAYQCNAGALTTTVTCSDPTLSCKPRSASDPTANVDDSGVVDCE